MHCKWPVMLIHLLQDPQLLNPQTGFMMGIKLEPLVIFFHHIGWPFPFSLFFCNSYLFWKFSDILEATSLKCKVFKGYTSKYKNKNEKFNNPSFRQKSLPVIIRNTWRVVSPPPTPNSILLLAYGPTLLWIVLFLISNSSRTFPNCGIGACTINQSFQFLHWFFSLVCIW